MAYERHTWVDGETITDTKLNNIEDGIEEAMGNLPEVTADDNGKVLMVVNGEWAVASLS